MLLTSRFKVKLSVSIFKNVILELVFVNVSWRNGTYFTFKVQRTGLRNSVLCKQRCTGWNKLGCCSHHFGGDRLWKLSGQIYKFSSWILISQFALRLFYFPRFLIHLMNLPFSLFTPFIFVNQTAHICEPACDKYKKKTTSHMCRPAGNINI